MPILKTRLYKPTVDKNFIYREKIVSLLEKNRTKPLTLIVAGAGYGKSIAVSQWLESTEIRYCWISLDEDFNEFRQAMTYLISAIQSIFPGSLQESLDMVNAIDLPSAKIITTTLINELFEIPQNLNIVLDDYHVIRNEEIHSMLEELMHHLSGKVKLTILTRHDPPFKMGLYSANDLLCEIRMAELRFTPDEIIRISNELYNFKLTPELAETIYKTTEGWIIGVRSLLKGLIEGRGIKDTLTLLNANQGNLKDYILGELFINQNVSVRKGILIASMFDRFSMDLIRWIFSAINTTAKEDLEIHLQEIANIIKTGMFIIPLDNEHIWFRFHHLIREFLRIQIHQFFSENQLNEFYKNACLYFESIQSLEESLKCALSSKDNSLILEIFTNNYPMLLNTHQAVRLERWLNMLPAGFIETNVEVLLVRAYFCDANGNYELMASELDKALRILPELDKRSEKSRNLWSMYYTIRSCNDFYTGKLDQSIVNSEKAKELFNSEVTLMHDYSVAFKSMALSLKGRTDLAIENLDNYQKKIHEFQRENLMRQNLIRAMVNAIQGHIHLVEDPSLLAAKISAEKNQWYINIMANYFLATIPYLQNNLNNIDHYIDSALEHRFLGPPIWVLNIYFTAGLALLANKKYNELDQLLARMNAYSEYFTAYSFHKVIKAYETEIALLQGEVQRAIKLADEANFEPYPVIFHFYAPQLTRIKLMLCATDIYSKQEIMFELERFIEQCKYMNINQLLLQAYALMAIAQIKYGGKKKALYFLRESLKLAREGGIVRTFLDLGEPVKTLFQALDENEKQEPFVRKIIKEFRQEKQISNFTFISAGTKKMLENETELTQREIEILQLIIKGHSNNEIAGMLFLSLGTIKTYIYNIYQKMGVKNRIAAISKSSEIFTALSNNLISKVN